MVGGALICALDYLFEGFFKSHDFREENRLIIDRDI
jgi:hypothetical protein